MTVAVSGEHFDVDDITFPDSSDSEFGIWTFAYNAISPVSFAGAGPDMLGFALAGCKASGMAVAGLREMGHAVAGTKAMGFKK